MRGFLDSYNQKKVTVWEVNESLDDFGHPVYSAHVSLVWGGVTGTKIMTRDDKGEEYHSEKQIQLSDDYSLNSWMVEGWHEGSQPEDVDEARRVVRKKVLQMVVGDEILGYEYML